jgi:hypothetical protein
MEAHRQATTRLQLASNLEGPLANAMLARMRLDRSCHTPPRCRPHSCKTQRLCLFQRHHLKSYIVLSNGMPSPCCTTQAGVTSVFRKSDQQRLASAPAIACTAATVQRTDNTLEPALRIFPALRCPCRQDVMVSPREYLEDKRTNAMAFKRTRFPAESARPEMSKPQTLRR